MTRDNLQPIGVDVAREVEAIRRAFSRVRTWQSSPEGQRARERHERERAERAALEIEERATLRGVPRDCDVRRWALEPAPAGDHFTAIAAALDWHKTQEKASRGRVPGVRFLLGPPGTGKTCALAQAVCQSPRRALYRTADAVSSLRRDSDAWQLAASVPLLALDEFGVEVYPDAVVELLLSRWASGLLTIGAGNLAINGFSERYFARAGERLADRIELQRGRGLAAFSVIARRSFRLGEGVK